MILSFEVWKWGEISFFSVINVNDGPWDGVATPQSENQALRKVSQVSPCLQEGLRIHPWRLFGLPWIGQGPPPLSLCHSFRDHFRGWALMVRKFLLESAHSPSCCNSVYCTIALLRTAFLRGGYPWLSRGFLYLICWKQRWKHLGKSGLKWGTPGFVRMFGKKTWRDGDRAWL